MNLPGFTAPASLFRSPVSYVVGSQASQSFGSSDSVRPAMAIYVNGVYYCDGEVTGSGVECYGSGGGGGGPREPLCRPSCGPCRNVPVQGRVKTCILRNCDDVEKRC